MTREQIRNLPVQEESLEIELGSEELRNASRPRISPAPAEPTRGGSGQSPAVIAGASTAVIVAACAGVWALNAESPREIPPPPPEPLAAVVETPAAEAPLIPEGPPVRIRNPFDKSEVFEFPPGTSEEDAHAKVADALMQRAMERQALLATRPAKRKRAAEQPTRNASQRRRV